MILYHLRAVAGRRDGGEFDRKFEVKRAIERELVYFASPATFNDLLDSRVGNFDLQSLTVEQRRRFVDGRVRSMKRTLSAEKRLTPQQLEKVLDDPRKLGNMLDGLQADVNRRGVLCLTEDPRNDALWSLYADRHGGIALCFEFPEDRALLHVRYSDEPLPLMLGEEDDVLALLGTKSTYWRHEREHRAIELSGAGWHGFSEPVLRGIIFGWKIDPGIRTDLLRWVDRWGPQLRAWQAEPKRGHRALRFDVVRAGARDIDPERPGVNPALGS
jgi:hypothetical protein